MQEERLLILRLLEEGKVTADEAQELLAALEFTADVEDDGPRPAAPRRAGEEDGPESDIFEKLGSGLENLPSLVESLLGGFGLFGSGHKFEETIEGEFEGTDPIQVSLASVNGRITVHAWDGPGYKINLLKTVRAASEADAAEKAANMVECTRDGGSLSVATRRGINGVSLRIEAHLPRDRRYRLDLNSSNGRLEVEDLNAEEIAGHTSNGRIVVTGCRVATAKLNTSNGRIVAEGLEGNLVADTSNGRIEVAALPYAGDRTMNLKTSNGSINLRLIPGADHGYRVDARTSHGTIKLSCPDLEVTEGEGKVKEGVLRFKRHLKAETRDIASRKNATSVSARTSNGSIRLSEGSAGSWD